MERHYKNINNDNISKSLTLKFLQKDELFPEREIRNNFIGQGNWYKNYKKYVMKNVRNDTCRECNQTQKVIVCISTIGYKLIQQRILQVDII